MYKTTFLMSFGLLLLITPVTAGSANKSFNVLNFGAKPDGKTLCTQAIQNAVDQCAESGGGTVYFPAGTWLTGTV
ncbi:MAG: glycosyl hydrolase family 28-related protein [Planctomycetota bacterium]|jgi:polygalacturonase